MVLRLLKMHLRVKKLSQDICNQAPPSKGHLPRQHFFKDIFPPEERVGRKLWLTVIFSVK